MSIHRVGGHGTSGPGESGSNFFESTEAWRRLLNVVSEPGSTVKIEQPTLHGRVRQDARGVYHFSVTYRDEWPEETVTFNASTGRDGRFVEKLTFEKNGMIVTPVEDLAENMFFERVVEPLYGSLFAEKVAS